MAVSVGKPRKGVGVDRSVMTNEVSRENPSSLEFVIFPAAGEKYHSQTCHHVFSQSWYSECFLLVPSGIEV